jgi:KaiC/GvpD/RAD55 family RecA-like ATPase
MGIAVRKEQCPECAKNGGDTARDNLIIYEDESFHCFACGYTRLSDSERSLRGLDTFIWSEEDKMAKEPLTKEQIEIIKDNTGDTGANSRGISDKTYRAFAVRFEYNEADGSVDKHLYPITENYKASGYKVRKLPKNFEGPHKGKFGQDSDLFGQWKFKSSNSKNVVITAGEIDCLSAFQILEDYRGTKDFEPTPVVSSVIGESGSYKQIRKHYDWFNRFEKIIICYDNDKAGHDAVKAVAKVLPKGKVYVMDLPLKDSNEHLVNNKTNSWLTAYFKARPYVPDGIISSSELSDKIRELASIEKIPLPPFMHKLQDMMAGGIPLKRIVNIGSASGTGKSTLVDEMVYYWIFNSPHKIGVVTLESESGEYGTKLLSRHVGRKIDLIQDIGEKLEYLNSELVLEKEQNLWCNEQGQSRFNLIEDRDGGLESMKKKIEELIISCDVKVVILDPLQDILDGLSNEDQSVFMRWMKGMTKSHDVTFINISHIRKSQGGQKANSIGANIYEEDFQGSSSIFKSGACNLLFTRDKEAEDDIERNTTYMKATKIRWTGRTGIVGEYYYDNETHTMHDKSEWMNNNQQIAF